LLLVLLELLLDFLIEIIIGKEIAELLLLELVKGIPVEYSRFLL
jgi:hypothetical protein